MALWDEWGVPTLLVAVAGGHLEELVALRRRLVPIDDDVVWVTTDTAHSRSLLAGERCLFAPHARPRDAAATLATSRFAHEVLSSDRFGDVVSTGALIAVPFLTLARLRGARCHFLESAARLSGPSLSGRILERVPGVRCYSPYATWHRPSWLFRGSVFDGFAPSPRVTPELRSVVVTVGTSGFDFGRLLARLAHVLPPACEVVWQTGSSQLPDALAARARPFLSAHELRAAMARADLVVSHAGVGSALAALGAGRAPLLVARRADHGEHVDDHQLEVAAELTRRGLATSCALDELDTATLLAAAARRVAISPFPPPFRLAGTRAGAEEARTHEADRASA